MYFSIDFNDKNTWDDWHLVPMKRPAMSPPALKTQTVDVPGGNGVLDLSRTLTGYPVYKNRTGSIEFMVMNDYQEWIDLYDQILNYLHGRVMKMTFEEDPDYYYEGTMTVSGWNSDKDWSKITIAYDVGPYKWARVPRTEEIVLEDSATAVTKQYSRLNFDAAPITPKLVVDCEDGVDVTFENAELGISYSKHFVNGTHEPSDIVLYGDSISFSFQGKGTVTLITRGGRL